MQKLGHARRQILSLGLWLIFLAAPVAADGSVAQRILSIGGDVTEIIYALGAGGRVVAVDTSSLFPAEALKEKKIVGYMRALAPEGVLSVGADLIVATDRAGPADVVRSIKSSVNYIEVPEGNSPDGVVTKVRVIARAIGKEADGEALAKSIVTELATLDSDHKKIGKPLRALFILTVVNGRATVGGAGTNADAILKLAGLENAANNLAGFKPVGDEALLEMRPDIVVTMKQVSGSGLNTSQLWSMPGIVNSPAGAERRLIEMDGLYLLGFGPRVAAAARDLMRAAYPTVAVSAPAR